MTVEETTKLEFLPHAIRTANDAVQAFLEERITEKELKEAVTRFGLPSLPNPNQFPADAGYKRTIPDFCYPVPEAVDSFEDRNKANAEKQKVRDKATAAAEKKS